MARTAGRSATSGTRWVAGTAVAVAAVCVAIAVLWPSDREPPRAPHVAEVAAPSALPTLSCDDVHNLIEVGVPDGLLVETVRSAGGADLTCLVDAGVDAARVGRLRRALAGP